MSIAARRRKSASQAPLGGRCAFPPLRIPFVAEFR
jgi:hypothetical protein